MRCGLGPKVDEPHPYRGARLSNLLQVWERMVSALDDCPHCEYPDFDGICVECGYGIAYQPQRDPSRYFHARLENGFTGRAEHIIVAENALGKPLPKGAIVHHHDQDRSNNKNTNLVICENTSYHQIIHARMNLIAIGADPDKEKRCWDCKQIKPLEEFTAERDRYDGRAKRCKKCRAAYQRERRIKKATMLVGDRRPGD